MLRGLVDRWQQKANEVAHRDWSPDGASTYARCAVELREALAHEDEAWRGKAMQEESAIRADLARVTAERDEGCVHLPPQGESVSGTHKSGIRRIHRTVLTWVASEDEVLRMARNVMGTPRSTLFSLQVRADHRVGVTGIDWPEEDIIRTYGLPLQRIGQQRDGLSAWVFRVLDPSTTTLYEVTLSTPRWMEGFHEALIARLGLYKIIMGHVARDVLVELLATQQEEGGGG